MGKGSTGDEREMAKRIGQLSDKDDPTFAYEGTIRTTGCPIWMGWIVKSYTIASFLVPFDTLQK